MKQNFFVFWQALSSTITAQSFIGLALMVPEIIRGSLNTPLGPLNGKKPGLNRVKHVV